MKKSLPGLCIAVIVGASACSSSPAAIDTTVPVNTLAPTISPAPTDTTAPTGTPVSGTPRVTLSRISTVRDALDIAFRNGDTTQFVVSRDGFIAVIRNGVLADDHVLDISKTIVSGGEQGLLGLAFATDGKHAYVNFTNSDGNTIIAEYAVGSDGTFDPASQRQLLKIDQPYPNHNGGAIRVGPDGYLYIGTGDGGAGGDPERRALDTGDLLGKILRIDPTPSAGKPYTIPADNPFLRIQGARPEIWSIGLRNPWRFSFDRTTADLWIADVGQDTWEEIDVATAATGAGRGSNFGWSAFEGTHRFNADQSADGVTMPIFEYQHGDSGCSISGGVRYRGAKIPTLVGWYVFGDYCSGQLRALQINPDLTAGTTVTLATDIRGLASVAQGPDGELYVLSVETGEVFAIRPSN